MVKTCKLASSLASIFLLLGTSVDSSGATTPSGLGGGPSKLQTGQELPDLASAAARASPSVVTVIAERIPSFAESLQAPSLIPPPYQPEMEGYTASGVVVEPGYILTNYHVVARGARLRVRLRDGREREARVTGADPVTDLAVLRVEDISLPAITLGSSDALRVGEWVLAIGSPFGPILDHTVTAGVVSAKGRSDLRLIEYEDFLQTDAAIHPGNSGGALVNLRGELVGIIAAVVGRGGISSGIAFAIPVAVARDVFRDIVKEGRVRRGYLGLQTQDLTPSLREALELPVSRGALLSTVQEAGPAQAAGLRRGDVVVGFDGKSIASAAELRRDIAQRSPARSVLLEFYRRTERHVLSVDVSERPQAFSEDRETSRTIPLQLGLSLVSLTPSLADRLGYEGRKGLVVLDVVPGSAGYRTGLWAGDLIEEIDEVACETPEKFVAYVESRRGQRPVLLLVRRGALESFAALSLK